MRSAFASAAREIGAAPSAPFGERVRRQVQALFDRRRHLLVDVADEPAHRVSGGIGRAVRELTRHLTLSAGADLCVRPVRSKGTGFRSAEDLSVVLFGGAPSSQAPERVRVRRGDRVLLLGLDRSAFSPAVPDLVARIRRVRARGGEVFAMVHDLHPIDQPESYRFPAGTPAFFAAWLAAICTECDGILCSSRTMTGRLASWLAEHPIPRTRSLPIGFFHLGTDGTRTLPEPCSAEETATIDRLLSLGPSVLIVAQLYLLKGYEQVLAAFERLWGGGADLRLVVVGDTGAPESELKARLAGHTERDRRLFWFAHLSGEALLRLYRECSVLLGASLAEGFGLPVLEAAREGLPLILRDLPIYRETAGSAAIYFSGESVEDLVAVLEEWQARRARGEELAPTTALSVTWAQSAARLLKLIDGRDWSHRWLPEGRVA
jgi:glycosyltransferase involved in cell wall biosynthesis